MSQRNVGKRVHLKVWCKREGGSVMLQKGEGEARENNLERFVASMASHKVIRGNFPKSATSLTPAWLHFSHSFPPTSIDYFQCNASQMGFIFFSHSP